MKKIYNYINGEFLEPIGNNYLENIAPATGSIYSLTPDSDAKDVQLAVDSANLARQGWGITPAEKRAEYLFKIADMIEARFDEFTSVESIDTGKPLSLTQEIDIPRSIQNLKFFASSVIHNSTQAHINENRSINYTIRQPIGIVGTITPWNLPLYLLTWKIAPAIATGNSVIAKPSEITPMTAYLLSKVCKDVKLPSGVLNIIHGLGTKVGTAMTSHPDIKAISFTGSTKVGKEIARVSASFLKKVSLELGGKNPIIVFADCNYKEMINTTIKSSFQNQGQICLCGSRIYIEEDIFEKFKFDFVRRTEKLRVGDPNDSNTDLGAVVSKQHLEKIKSCVGLAREEGGNILTGGKPFLTGESNENGYFYEPTIISGLDINCRTNQEEIFGPVVTIQPFKSDEQAIKFANSTNYGLATTIWTNNLNRAHKLANLIDSGIIWINTWMLRDLRTPFGGMKESGIGREGGLEALRFFTETKNVCVKLS